jgi:hypothetical protein
MRSERAVDEFERRRQDFAQHPPMRVRGRPGPVKNENTRGCASERSRCGGQRGGETQEKKKKKKTPMDTMADGQPLDDGQHDVQVTGQQSYDLAKPTPAVDGSQ